MSVNTYNPVSGKLEKIAGGTLYADSPIGTILAYGGATAPSGWFLCQGQAISREDYSALFAVIGTAFGVGDGSTTFNLPDLRESVPKGAGLSGKSSTHLDADGLAVGEFIDDRIKSHTHSITDPGHTHSYKGGNWGINGGSTQIKIANIDSGNTTASATTKITINSTGSTTNEVKAVGVNYIIKAQQVALPNDLETAVEEKLDTALERFDTSQLVLSSRVNLNNYDGSTTDKIFVCPSDGMVQASVLGGTGRAVVMNPHTTGTSINNFINILRVSTEDSIVMTPVRKGMKISVSVTGQGQAYFYYYE